MPKSSGDTALLQQPLSVVPVHVASALRFLVGRRLAAPVAPIVLQSDATEEPVTDRDVPDARASTLAGKRVLICEDEGISQMQLRRALLRAGMVVTGTAPNGQVAVALALQDRPDLILMDIRMPVMDGIEASKRIMGEFKTCIVMLTAFSDEEYEQKAREAGARGYIVKPVTGESLVPQLEKVWEDYRNEAANRKD
jgi:CheY-like chemotaxis protein